MEAQIQDLLYDNVVAGLTGIELLALLVLITGVLVIYRTVSAARVVGIRSENISVRVECGNCGWSGVVSSFAPRCPNCAAQLSRSRHTVSPPTV